MTTSIKAMVLATFMVATTGLNAQFRQSCNKFKSGPYSLEKLKKDFNTTSANGFSRKGKGENRVTVVSGIKGKGLKVKYPKGGYDSKPSGAQWKTNLNGTYNELFLSYYVKPGKNFELNKIGKLPGFGGGAGYSDRGRSSEWSGKLMWRKGRTEFYLHSPYESKKKFPWNKKGNLKKNKWNHIQIRYKMNTVGKDNGIMEAWLNGKKVAYYNNITFRKSKNVGITMFFFSTFYGGNKSDAPSKTNYAFFDEFIVSKKKITKPKSANASENLLLNDNTKSVNVYPNPAELSFNIDLKDLKDAHITIYNISGKQVYQSSGNNGIVEVNTDTQFNPGLHLVKIIDQNRNIYTQKVMLR